MVRILLFLIMSSFCFGQDVMPMMAMGTTSAPQTIIIDYSPALLNGDLEAVTGENFDNWNEESGAFQDTTSTAGDGVHGGTHGAVIYGGWTDLQFGQTGVLTVGKHYTLTYWAKKNQAGEAYLGYTFGLNSNLFEHAIGTSWTQYTDTNKLCTDDGNGNFSIRAYTASGMIIMLDDIKLVQLD